MDLTQREGPTENDWDICHEFARIHESRIQQPEREMVLAPSPTHVPKDACSDYPPIPCLGVSVLFPHRRKGETRQVEPEDVPAYPVEGGRETDFCLP